MYILYAFISNMSTTLWLYMKNCSVMVNIKMNISQLTLTIPTTWGTFWVILQWEHLLVVHSHYTYNMGDIVSDIRIRTSSHLLFICLHCKYIGSDIIVGTSPSSLSLYLQHGHYEWYYKNFYKVSRSSTFTRILSALSASTLCYPVHFHMILWASYIAIVEHGK